MPQSSKLELRLALAAMPLLLMSCAQVLGIDETHRSEPTASDAATIDANSASDAAVVDAAVVDAAIDAAGVDADLTPTLACAESQFFPALGSSSFNTESKTDDLVPSCGSAGTGDLLYSWRAPVSDYYVFDTAGSEFDTVLSLLDACEGNELACNNNVESGTSSEIVAKIAINTDLLIAVDGFGGDQGNGVLNIDRVSCPDSDLEGQTLPLTLSTAGHDDDYSNSCGGTGWADRAYHWVVPTDGLWAFKAVSESYSTVLTVFDGPRCNDTQLGCSGAAQSSMRSEVVRRLDAGQQVSIYVDGFDGEGAFELAIEDRSATTCPALAGPTVGNPITSGYSPRTLAPSCGFPEVSDGIASSAQLDDQTLALNIPPPGAGCESLCTVTIQSTGLFSAYILDQGDCGGREIACVGGVLDAGTATATIELFLQGNVGGAYTLVVADSIWPSDEEVTTSIDCEYVCA